MAKTNPPRPDLEPLADLTKEARESLESMGSELDKSDEMISALEEIGMDMSRLKERTEWAKKARAIMLKTLTKQDQT